jgi:hypothetical protein
MVLSHTWISKQPNVPLMTAPHPPSPLRPSLSLVFLQKRRNHRPDSMEMMDVAGWSSRLWIWWFALLFPLFPLHWLQEVLIWDPVQQRWSKSVPIFLICLVYHPGQAFLQVNTGSSKAGEKSRQLAQGSIQTSPACANQSASAREVQKNLSREQRHVSWTASKQPATKKQGSPPAHLGS